MLQRAKTTLRRIADRPHTKAASDAAIRALLKNPGIRAPRPEEIRRARAYAEEELGDWQLYPELLVYTTYRGAFHEGWITNTLFTRVLPIINHGYFEMGRARTLARRILQTDLLPDLAFCIGNSWFDPDGQPVAPAQVRDLLFARGDRVFIKTESSRGGYGVRLATARDFDEAAVRSGGNCVVQRAIEQCALFNRINPHGVCTIRVITTRAPGGDPRAVASFLKMGLGRETHVNYNAIHVPILDRAGHMADRANHQSWALFPEHPDSGFRFAGRSVDGHERALEACETLHRRVPQFTVIGWDVTINAEGGIELMEWNTRHPGIDLPEASRGPCFADLRLGQVLRRHGAGQQPFPPPADPIAEPSAEATRPAA